MKRQRIIKATTILAICLAVTGLTACGKENKTKEVNDTDFTETYKKGLFRQIHVWVDPKTGVNYLIYDGDEAGGITVRLNQDGTPYVTKPDTAE